MMPPCQLSRRPAGKSQPSKTLPGMYTNMCLFGMQFDAAADRMQSLIDDSCYYQMQQETR